MTILAAGIKQSDVDIWIYYGCEEPCALPRNSVSVLMPDGTGRFTQAAGSPYHLSGVTVAVGGNDFTLHALGDVAFGDGYSCHGNRVGALLQASGAGVTPEADTIRPTVARFPSRSRLPALPPTCRLRVPP